jgi:hypothetical protein
MMRRWSLLAFLVIVAAVPALGDGNYRVTPVEAGGSISGRVVFEGDVPESTPAKGPDDCPDADTRVGPQINRNDKGVQWAVVYLESITSGKDWPADTVNLRIGKCQFSHRTVVVPVGGTLVVTNEDRIGHRVKGETDLNEPFVRSLEPGDSFKTILDFEEFDRLTTECHYWESCAVVVAPHPYYAVTGSDGSFSLENVPPGAYRLAVWHESLTGKTVEVEVGPNGTVTANLSLSN